MGRVNADLEGVTMQGRTETEHGKSRGGNRTHWYSVTSVSKSTTSTPTNSRFSSTIDALSWSVASSKPRKSVERVLGGMVSAVTVPEAQAEVKAVRENQGERRRGNCRGRSCRGRRRERESVERLLSFCETSPSKFMSCLPRSPMVLPRGSRRATIFALLCPDSNMAEILTGTYFPSGHVGRSCPSRKAHPPTQVRFPMFPISPTRNEVFD